MFLKFLRLIGLIFIVPFGIFFTLYVLLFPIVGTVFSLYLVNDFCEEKGLGADDLAFVPIAIFTIVIQSLLSWGAIELVVRSLKW